MGSSARVHQFGFTHPGGTHRHTQPGDALEDPGGHHADMRRTTPADARLDVLQAAVVALMAVLPPDRAATARALFLAGVADLEDRPADAAADAAAAGTVATLLGALPLNI